MDNGLPSNHVYKVAQDYSGFVWILTDRGMVRYDGNEFHVFTTRDGLPVNDIWDVRMTPDGKVWFMTRATKLGYIDGDEVVTFENATAGKSLYPSTILQAGNSISFVGGDGYYELSDSLSGRQKWIRNTTNKKIWHAKGRRLIESLNQATNAYYFGQVNDSLSICMGSKTYAIFNQNSGQLIKHQYSEFVSGISEVISTRFFAQNGQVQIFGMGFIGILDKNGHLTQVSQTPAQYHAHANMIDKNGNLWMGTTSNGVYLLESSARQTNYPIVGQKVSRIKIINQQIIASVFDKGFYAYQPKHGAFYQMIQDKGAIYTGLPIGYTEYYLTDYHYFKRKQSHQKRYSRDLEKGAIFDALMFQDTFFGIGSMMLVAMDISNFEWKNTTISVGLSDLLVYQNRLFLASSTGLLEYSHGQIKKAKIGQQTFDKPSLHLDICAGKLIIGTDGFGAYATDLEEVVGLPESDFLSVPSAFAQANQLWLAASSGVLHYNFEHRQVNFVKKYTQNDGLLSQSASDVLVYGDSLMVASDAGISVLPKESSQRMATTLRVFFKDVAYGSNPLSNQSAFDYQSDAQLAINIGFVDFSRNPTGYEYRLRPLMEKWQHTAIPNLNFNNLSPKVYELEIRKDGKLAKMSFEIRPLWYQTAFAKILLALSIFFGIIYFALTFNRNQLQKQKERLSIRQGEIEQELYALRSQMNPHFVFNSLNAIQYYIANNDIDLSEKYLVQFSKLIRLFFNFSRKRTISLKDELELLELYLSIEQMRFGEQLKFNFWIDPSLDLMNTYIPTMLLQPILENAVNHGIFHKKGIGHILVKLEKVNQKAYRIIIADDGIGWKNVQEVLKKSLSNRQLSSTKVLLEKINLLNQSKHWDISLQVTDNLEDKSGTVVQFDIQQVGKIIKSKHKNKLQKMAQDD